MDRLFSIPLKGWLFALDYNGGKDLMMELPNSATSFERHLESTIVPPLPPQSEPTTGPPQV